MIEENFLKVAGLIKKLHIDAFLINDPSDLYYVSGRAITGYTLLAFRDGVRVISPPLLYDQLKTVYAGSTVMLSKDVAAGIGKIVSAGGVRNIGVDPAKTSVMFYEKLQKTAGRDVIVKVKGLVAEARQVKSRTEIDLIRKSCAVAAAAMREIKRTARPGESEQSLAVKIKKIFLNRGAESAFEPIVAAGRNSAYPHHINGSVKLPRNGAVTVDIGCRFGGYCSDLTRVLFLGKINMIFRRYYEAVLSARELALKSIKPGVRTGRVDGAARAAIAGKGLGELFIHSTGHGIGIDVHEKPVVSEKGIETLRQGMVVTIEPGIYNPGLGGIRIEDTVLVTRDGYEILTKEV